MARIKLLVVLMFIFSAHGQAIAQLPVGSAEQPVDQQSIESDTIKRLHLNRYEAVTGDLSACGDDEICVRHAKRINSWLCAASACEEKNMKVHGCFEEIPEGLESKIDTLFCLMILSPSDQTRQSIADNLNLEITEEELFEYGAYILAVRSGVDSCENYIESYLQAQGLEWSVKWGVILSGCRILSGATTREQEEEKFRARFGAFIEVPPVSSLPAHEMQ